MNVNNTSNIYDNNEENLSEISDSESEIKSKNSETQNDIIMKQKEEQTEKQYYVKWEKMFVDSLDFDNREVRWRRES